MPRVRGLRGVCIGVGQVLLPGDECDIDDGLSKYLVSIGAVQVVPDPAPIAKPEPAPVKTGTKEKQP